MKKYLVLLFFALTTSVCFGHGSNQDIVYLKNGSIIRRIIIEPESNISIADRNVFAYQMDKIEKLTKEPFKRRSNRTLKGSDGGLKEGYKGIVELGYEIGTGNFGMDRIILNIINGYQINPYFSLAFGTGLRHYLDTELLLIPIFADFRTNLIDNNVSPYISLGVGYSFATNNSFIDGGFLLNPTVGISFIISDKSSMNVGIGYDMQRLKLYSWWDDFTENSNAISIKVGLSF